MEIQAEYVRMQSKPKQERKKKILDHFMKSLDMTRLQLSYEDLENETFKTTI